MLIYKFQKRIRGILKRDQHIYKSKTRMQVHVLLNIIQLFLDHFKSVRINLCS